MSKQTEEQMDKRLLRRKRRVRNQVLAYIFLFIFLIGLVGGGLYGADRAFHIFDKKEPVPVEEPVEPEQPSEPIIAEPEEVPEPEVIDPQEQLMNEMVESYISQMTIQEKVAGLFIVTPEQLTGVDRVTAAGNTTKTSLEQYPVGGLIYFSRNILTYDGFKTMLTNTVEYSKYPLFLSLDEEGGSIARVAGTLSSVQNVQNMSEIGATGDLSNATTAYTSIAGYLTDLGINVDWAPVADVQTENNELFQVRSFGSDPGQVAQFVSTSVLALQENGVSACLKHFPGHGATDGDTEEGMAITNRTLDEMRLSELIPFQSGIEAGVDFVMVGHMSVPGITGDNTPASLSKTVVTDMLRTELGFEGIIVTDALNMPAITDYYLSEDATIAALQAGADMILMPDDFEASYEAVLDAIAEGTLSEERINESLRRIYRVKCQNSMITSLDEIGEE